MEEPAVHHTILIVITCMPIPAFVAFSPRSFHTWRLVASGPSIVNGWIGHGLGLFALLESQQRKEAKPVETVPRTHQ
ncbi:MAG: hypothetical protein FWE88_09030, partial [Phycisphaerae bacterium]|nr:hypothetical protein [Phycisphaerae bacterium]